MKTAYLVKVNYNMRDIHAAYTLDEALGLAMPDKEDVVHYCTCQLADVDDIAVALIYARRFSPTWVLLPNTLTIKQL